MCASSKLISSKLTPPGCYFAASSTIDNTSLVLVCTYCNSSNIDSSSIRGGLFVSSVVLGPLELQEEDRLGGIFLRVPLNLLSIACLRLRNWSDWDLADGLWSDSSALAS